jgi:hypothetical protein
LDKSSQHFFFSENIDTHNLITYLYTDTKFKIEIKDSQRAPSFHLGHTDIE